MARWDPNPRMRMVAAAVDLCSEQGYDATTVAEIAERAGLTKATFFRHFPDKREVLFAGQEEHSALLAAGIASAPGQAAPLDAVADGLRRLASSFTPEQHRFGPVLAAAVVSSVELRERDALKSAGLATAVAGALVGREVPEPAARLAGEVGALAAKRGFARWCEGDDDAVDALAGQMLGALGELRSAAAALV